MQGASWSSVDFGGNWRLLHYSMQKTYAPFLITVSSQDDSSEVWAVSDINAPVTGDSNLNSYTLDCISHCCSQYVRTFYDDSGCLQNLHAEKCCRDELPCT